MAEDLAHDTILRALAMGAHFRDGTNLTAWLFCILNNLFRDAHRRRQRLVALEPALRAHIEQPPCSNQEEPGWVDANVDDVRKHLTRLSQPFREAAELAYLKRLPHAQISAHLGISTATVATRIHRARRALRALMMSTEPTRERPAGLGRTKALRQCRAPL